MNMRIALAIGAGLLFSMSSRAAEGTPSETYSLAKVQTEYTCAQLDELKFNKTNYLALNPVSRVIVDGQWTQCQNKRSDEQFVLVANPLATSENDKLFYGTVKQASLDNAVTYCKTGGAVLGTSLSVASLVVGNAAAGEVGSAVYNYSGVSCDALGDGVADGNLMLFLGPTSLVAHAVAAKISKDTIELIPLLSDADKGKLKEFVDRVSAPPTVTVGQTIIVSGVGFKVSVEKPRVVIKAPKVTPPKIPDQLPEIRIGRPRITL